MLHNLPAKSAAVQFRVAAVIAAVLTAAACLPASAAEKTVSSSSNASAASAVPPGASPGHDFFESKIRPLLVEHCQQCHGEKKQWAGLRLDSRDAMLTGGDSGPAVVPGKPEESELFRRVSETDEDLRMPPADAAAALSTEQVALLRHWIATGAAWPAAAPQAPDARALARKNHWAFQPVARPTVPEVADRGDVENPIDRFVLAKLGSEGLDLSPQADRRTLLRRASYDLTGLPPSSEEVAAFAADESPDGYRRTIERLLESPQYGEQWGRHWLDVARYADTKGYVYAREERFFAHSAAYRDWVIRAFNDDMPYDRFVLLQLAADKAAPDDASALAALGFLTVGKRFLGLMPDIIDDRIDVVGRGLLGLTVGCARCHDHKYDPIPTADYYSLYGVFANCVERQVPLPRPPGAAPPTQEFEAGLAERRKKVAEAMTARRTEGMAAIRARVGDYLLALRRLEDHGVFTTIVGKEDLMPAVAHRFEVYMAQAERDRDPVFVPWIALAKLKEDEFPAAASELCRQWLQPDAGVHPRVARVFASPPVTHKEAAERYATLFKAVDAQWSEACKTAAAAGRPAPKSLPDPDDEALRQFLHGPRSPCVIPDEPIVNIEFCFDTRTTESLWNMQGEVDRWLNKHPGSLPVAAAMFDREQTDEPRVFRRGNIMTKGDFVPRQFLEVVAGPTRQPFTQGSGRLEMAHAIVSPGNPLTARVWVNRVWLHHFGRGLVSTPSDFGVRAAPPSHPELLDWLAQEFMSHGWSTKWLHRTIMQSRTYRQSCSGPADEAVRSLAVERDPDNRLLWRMNFRRLSLEEMRDSMIAVAGELDASQGGNPVDPFKRGPDGFRRSVYMLIDRQYLPPSYNAFDFANPDLHTPQRSETIVPQQALFALNSPFVADRARAVARQDALMSSPERRVRRVFERVLQRPPTADDTRAGLAFIAAAATMPNTPAPNAAGGLNPWEQLAQVLLMSNEFMFVD
jgi:mono/diheme cytochrome c family protein